jgi:hypothetical protein
MGESLFSGIDHDVRRCRDAILLLRAKVRTQLREFANSEDVAELRDELDGTVRAEEALNRLVQKLAEKGALNVG